VRPDGLCICGHNADTSGEVSCPRKHLSGWTHRGQVFVSRDCQSDAHLRSHSALLLRPTSLAAMASAFASATSTADRTSPGWQMRINRWRALVQAT